MAQLYETLTPALALGLPLLAASASADYSSWPELHDLLPASFPGVKTSRDDFLVAIDRKTLEERLSAYFDPKVSHEEMARLFHSVMEGNSGYDPVATRTTLLKRGRKADAVVRYAYRPFDVRWLYREPETKLLDRNRAESWPHTFEGNVWLEAREKQAKEAFSRGTIVRHLADNFGSGLSSFFPMRMAQGDTKVPNISKSAGVYLKANRAETDDLFHHVVAILHCPQYRHENHDALRMGWPRIPLPKGSETLIASAKLGQTLVALLDPESPVPGVTAGAVRPELKLIAKPSRVGGGNLAGDDFALTAGWGHAQGGGIVMPARGKTVGRNYTEQELAELKGGEEKLGLSSSDLLSLVGMTTFDIYLNGSAYWSNVPAAVCGLHLGRVSGPQEVAQLSRTRPAQKAALPG